MFVCPSRRLGFSKPFIGEIITFDQLALRAPTGKNTLMIQGEQFQWKLLEGMEGKDRFDNRGVNLILCRTTQVP